MNTFVKQSMHAKINSTALLKFCNSFELLLCRPGINLIIFQMKPPKVIRTFNFKVYLFNQFKFQNKISSSGSVRD